MKTDCMELLFEASKYHMLPNKQPLFDSQRTRVRGAGPCLLALGGKGMGQADFCIVHKIFLNSSGSPVIDIGRTSFSNKNHRNTRKK